MIKKLLFTILALMSFILVEGQITITTTSNSATWTPDEVRNFTGAVLTWTASSNADYPGETIIANEPVFDFSLNINNEPIIVTIDNVDNLVGLTRLYVPFLEITNFDVSQASDLEDFNFRGNNYTSIPDFSSNLKLKRLYGYGNNYPSIDISNNPDLEVIYIHHLPITELNIDNNPLLKNVALWENDFTSSAIDNIVNKLDSYGLSNGYLFLRVAVPTMSALTPASATSFQNLINKGWRIDIPQINIIGQGNSIPGDGSNTPSPSDNTYFGTTALSGTTVRTFTIENAAIHNTLSLTDPSPYITISGVDAADFSISLIPLQQVPQASDPALPAASVPGTSTFEISFSPLAVGVKNATITVNNNDPYHQNYNFNIQAEATLVPGANLYLTGNGNHVTGDATNTPSVADNTDFGSDFIVNPITRTFTIQNLGDTSLDLTDPSPYITITGANPSDFTVSAIPTTPVASGTSTTFNITFDAATAGLKMAIINIANNSSSVPLYSFNIQAQANALAPGAEIEVTGNSLSIISGSPAQIANGTNFGQVALGSSLTRTFTIQNVGDSNLLLTLPGFGPNSPYTLTTSPPASLASGASDTFEITFTPTSIGSFGNFYGFFNNDGTGGENPFFLNLAGEGIAASSGSIDVLGNGISIANPDTTPDLADGTDFGQETIGITKTQTFTIENTSLTEILTIDDISVSITPTNFVLSGLPSFPTNIVAGGQITFNIGFTPTADATYASIVRIDNSDPSEDPYQFAITGKGTTSAISNDIMITQYYSGTVGTSNKWIEIKNISGGPINAGDYFLALYDNATSTAGAPTQFQSIAAMATGEVLLYRNASALLPIAGNLGSVSPIDSPVCNFDGNDIIVISTTNDATCYANRQDIIGDTTSWGPEVSFIRGGCASESPNIDFDINEWIELSITTDVQVANPNTNIALGTQAIGSTIWNGVTWTNLQPDKTRSVQMSGNYTAADGSFDACNLIIDSGVFLNLDGGTTNTVAVEKNLTINGSFTVGDTESLVTYDPSPLSITGNITKKESSTPRANQHDVTYWSSPISNGNISSVFSGVTPSRIWLYNQSLTTVSDPNDPAIYNAWVVASGPMTRGRGYAAEGLTGSTAVHNIEFTGKPNNGSISREIFVNVDSDRDNDFNLIGNPYPSAINVQNFFDANSNVDKVVYLWTHAQAISNGTSGDFAFNDYATLNLTGGTTVDEVPAGGTGVGGGPVPTNNIGSSQGFMVRGLSNGFANFNNTMRVKNANDQFFKQANTKNKADELKNQQDRIWLNLTSDQGGFNQLLVGFMEKATEGFDDGYDALKIGQDNALVFYSVLDNDKYAIQGLSPFTEDKSIALGFDANVAPRTFKVSIDHMEGALTNAEIFLVDNLLGKVHDLKQGDYEFEVTEVGENKDRFTLQFKGAVLGVEDVVAKQDFIISNQTGSLRINSKQTVKSLRVYDVLGRMLIQQKPNQQAFDINTGSIKNGTVLIIEATLENGASVNRKTIAF